MLEEDNKITETTEQANTTPPAKKRLGVSADIVATSQIPFDVTPENPFNKAYISSVEAKDIEFKKGDKKGTTEKVLAITFESPDKTKRHQEMFFPIVASTRHSEEDLYKWFAQKIKHLVETFIPFTPEVAEKLSADSYGELFEQIADLFNTGSNGKPIFKTEDGKYRGLWLKLTYSTKGNLQLPFPNFVEAYVTANTDKPKTLTVGAKDLVTRPVSAPPSSRGPVTTSPDNDLPPGF